MKVIFGKHYIPRLKKLAYRAATVTFSNEIKQYALGDLSSLFHQDAIEYSIKQNFDGDRYDDVELSKDPKAFLVNDMLDKFTSSGFIAKDLKLSIRNITIEKEILLKLLKVKPTRITLDSCKIDFGLLKSEIFDNLYQLKSFKILNSNEDTVYNQNDCIQLCQNKENIDSSKLFKLYLSNMKLCENCFCHIKEVHTNLHSFTLFRCNLMSISGHEFFCIPSVTKLDLGWSKVDLSSDNLKKIDRNDKIKFLDLSFTIFSDDGDRDYYYHRKDLLRIYTHLLFKLKKLHIFYYDRDYFRILADNRDMKRMFPELFNFLCTGFNSLLEYFKKYISQLNNRYFIDYLISSIKNIRNYPNNFVFGVYFLDDIYRSDNQRINKESYISNAFLNIIYLKFSQSDISTFQIFLLSDLIEVLKNKIDMKSIPFEFLDKEYFMINCASLAIATFLYYKKSEFIDKFSSDLNNLYHFKNDIITNKVEEIYNHYDAIQVENDRISTIEALLHTIIKLKDHYDVDETLIDIFNIFSKFTQNKDAFSSHLSKFYLTIFNHFYNCGYKDISSSILTHMFNASIKLIEYNNKPLSFKDPHFCFLIWLASNENIDKDYFEKYPTTIIIKHLYPDADNYFYCLTFISLLYYRDIKYKEIKNSSGQLSGLLEWMQVSKKLKFPCDELNDQRLAFSSLILQKKLFSKRLSDKWQKMLKNIKFLSENKNELIGYMKKIINNYEIDGFINVFDNRNYRRHFGAISNHLKAKPFCFQ